MEFANSIDILRSIGLVPVLVDNVKRIVVGIDEKGKFISNYTFDEVYDIYKSKVFGRNA